MEQATQSPAAAAETFSLRGVTYGYETGRPVVEGATASLRAGRVCAVIGPNAAGKTTLLRLMLGQLEPWAGAVELEGRAVAAMPVRERARRMSYVPQRGGVSFAFTVREVVAMGRFAAGGGRDVEAAMRACEVEGLGDRPFVELSGGQQQRVLVARAMAQASSGGRVMLLDEPGSNMDLRHQHALMRLLRLQAEAGLAVCVVLHDLNLAAAYADDVWLMEAGRVTAAGPRDEVMTAERLAGAYGVALRVVEVGGRAVFVAEGR